MKKFIALSLLATAVSGGSVLAQAPAPAPALNITTSAFTDGGVIPDKYTQASPSPVTPALSWTNTPAGTQSFTLIMHDVDTAPRKISGDILHWMAFNIPGTATSLPENVPTTATLPDGTIQPNNFGGKPGFMGPGAPKGFYHHYVIELYALDNKLLLSPTATRTEVIAAMDGHVLGKSAVVGRFHR